MEKGLVHGLQVMNRHNVYLYTPVLSENLVTQFLPPRWNEILSVYHIKSYIFDDNMIISGANLSNDYFTTRIDRYVLFENCPELINYYEKFSLPFFIKSPVFLPFYRNTVPPSLQNLAA